MKISFLRAFFSLALLSWTLSPVFSQSDEDPPQPAEERPESVEQVPHGPGVRAEPAAPPQVVAPIPPLPNEPPAIPRPQAHEKTRLAGHPERGRIERATPRVEIWRADTNVPQHVAGVQARRSQAGRLGTGKVTGTDPVTLVIRFNRALAGQILRVTTSAGVEIEPSAHAMQLGPTAEAALQLSLEEAYAVGQIVFEIDTVRTVLPLMRVPAAMLNAAEAAPAHEVAQ